MSIVGIYGDGSLGELQAMASMMPHRGTNLIAWSPANGVYLGELREESSNRATNEQLALDLESSTEDKIREDELDPATISLDQPSEFISNVASEGLENTLRRINTYFALAFWDADNRRLVLACDRMFYKGLYWIDLGTRIAFASEYKAILALPDCAAIPNRTVIQHYLKSKTAHKSFCMLEGVRSVGPARFLEITPGKVKLRDYWIPRLSPVRRSLHDNANILCEKLQKTAAYQSRAHQGVGFTLSGGVDSTMLLALFKKARPEADISTFTVGYDRDDLELAYARETAEYIGTEHHEIIADIERLPEDLPKLVWLTEECTGREESWLQTLVLKELSTHVDNVMSGLFADVLFCGMPRYKLLWLRDLAPPPLKTSLSELYTYTQIKQQPRTALGRLLVRKVYSRDTPEVPIVSGAHEEPFHVPASLNNYRTEKMKLMAGWLYHEPLERELKIHAMNPFCDKSIIELALSMPASHMMGWKLQKKVLRCAARGILPDSILKRPKAIQRLKHDAQLAQILQSMAETLLSNNGLAGRNLVQADYFKRLLNRSKNAAYSLETAQLLWALISLELWCKQFIDQRGKPLVP